MQLVSVLVLLGGVVSVGALGCKMPKKNDSKAVTDPPPADDAGGGRDDGADGGDRAGEGVQGLTVPVVGQLGLGFEDVDVDQSIAIPLGSSEQGPPLAGSVSAPVTSGQVAIEIPTGAGLHLQQGQGGGAEARDWTIALIDSSKAEKIDQVVGFLGLDTGADSLMKLPIDKVQGDGLDFGTISLVDGVAVASTSIADAAGKFAVEVAMLNEIASTDNVTRALKNVVANTSADGKTFYQVTPFFIYRSDMDGAKDKFTDLDAMKFAPTGAGDKSDFTYGFYFKAQDAARATFDQICNGEKILTFAPPSDLVKGATTYNAANPLTSAGLTKTTQGGQVECAGGEFYMSGSPGQAGFGFNFGGGGYDGAVLPGLWRMNIGPDPVAVFDLGAYSPVGADGKPLVYVPSIKITVDPATNKIDKIELKFAYWDKTSGTFKEVDDFSVMQRSVAKLQLGIIDNDGVNGGCAGSRIERRIDLALPTTGSVVTVQDFADGKWRFGGDASTTEKVANDIGVNYEIGGMAVTFSLLTSDDGC